MKQKNIVSEKKTCFKSKHNTSCIDLFITKAPTVFKIITTGLLTDFHKIAIIVLKATFTNSKPKVITYRDFNEEKFTTEFKNSKELQKFHHIYHVFEIFFKVLQRHDPIKNKTIRANHTPYVTKTMTKAIM